MDTVYRVENEEKTGCYQGVGSDSFLSKHNGNNQYPTPCHDRGINRYPEEKEYCGFLTLNQAMDWFSTNELKQLEKLGYYLKKIEVEEITAIGEHQILFTKIL